LVTESQVLKCLSDERSIEMLSNIQQNKLISPLDLKLTRKQYYVRLHNLVVCSLIRKANGRYALSSFGKVVFEWYLVLKDTISKDYWKLKAIDALDSSGIPDQERNKMFEALIGNEKLRQILSTYGTPKPS
jgi:predicted transcriptional regulator